MVPALALTQKFRPHTDGRALLKPPAERERMASHDEIPSRGQAALVSVHLVGWLLSYPPQWRPSSTADSWRLTGAAQPLPRFRNHPGRRIGRASAAAGFEIISIPSTTPQHAHGETFSPEKLGLQLLVPLHLAFWLRWTDRPLKHILQVLHSTRGPCPDVLEATKFLDVR